ncbi:MAG TPA: hypothetical protein VFG69_07625 [Nannocystaceae bacterium]|nr:hypothetical protein [Nannocystaceae bacterium]
MIAGSVGGAVLAALLVLLNVMRGYDPWVPLKTAAYPLLGELAIETGFAVIQVVLGILTHFAISIGWGILFALLFYGLSRAATLGVSLVWGAVVWLTMFYVVLPVAGAAPLVRGAPKGFAVLENLAFGVALGLAFLPFQRPRPRRIHGHVPST